MQITKEIIKELFYNSAKNRYNSARMNESYCAKHNIPYNEILHFYDDSESFFESVYRIINDINKRPICKVCGKILNFNRNDKFRTFCSAACSTHDPAVLAKNKAGVSKSLKKAYAERGEEIKAKRAQTLGNESGSPFENKDVQEKIKQTTLERYGVDNVFRLEQFRGNAEEQQRQKSIKLWKSRGFDIEYQDDNIIIKNGCKIHGDIKLSLVDFNNRMRPMRRLDDMSNVCPICKPIGDRQESSSEIIMKQILDELQIHYEQHNRSLIKPQELDFYIPEYNIAIECNGIWWHSDNYQQNKNYHAEKYNATKNAGIRLISIWEFDLVHNPDKVKAYIQTIFGKNKKIYARDCIIKKITAAESKEFLNNYHLQGNVNAKYKYGLFYKNELVEVMTFGGYRITMQQKAISNHYELYRLCTKAGYTVIGGASKLLAYFKKENPEWKEIISYCHNDISNGNVYKQLGFLFDSDCGPGLFYVHHHNFKVYSRYVYRRSQLKDIKPDEKVIDYLYNRGILTCYNSGVMKWRLTNEES